MSHIHRKGYCSDPSVHRPISTAALTGREPQGIEEMTQQKVSIPEDMLDAYRAAAKAQGVSLQTELRRAIYYWADAQLEFDAPEVPITRYTR